MRSGSGRPLAARRAPGHESGMADKQKPRPPASGDTHSHAFIEDLLSYFYPVHYRLGMEMEAAMCQGRVDRKQSALLWFVHSRTADVGWVRRKEVEAELSSWFEISNPKMSRMIRGLTTKELPLLELAENPASGREKMLRLTPAGRVFVEGMIDAAVRFLQARLGHVPSDQLAWGLRFFRLAFLPEDASKP